MILLQVQTQPGASDLWSRINAIDQNLFIYINRIWTNSFLDQAFPIWRESTTWIPLYLFLLVYSMMNLRSKAWIWILFLIFTVAVTDQVSSTFVKNWFNRPRPCRDPYFSQYVRLLLGGCPGSGSFTSSHATNHFGVGVFIAMTLKPLLKKWRYLFYFWAVTISYGQVYVGVHYPLDIVGGAILGSLIGYTIATIYISKIVNRNPAEQVSGSLTESRSD